MKSGSLSLVLVSLVLSSFLLQHAIADSPATYAPSFCDSKCGARCLNAGVKDRCLKYCGLCCQQCKCVPSGTYGNKSECPCYRDKLNSKGKSKCP
ncbi:peamaclein-like [Cucurbita moschata]|uniref:Peamaclein-like n=1 Tax=Cucurbita moschata TaxID=3662 RepID=A0A6J1HEX9_CUCMO|nr:peamaclein-like [Cucurbita moschata]